MMWPSWSKGDAGREKGKSDEENATTEPQQQQQQQPQQPQEPQLSKPSEMVPAGSGSTADQSDPAKASQDTATVAVVMDKEGDDAASAVSLPFETMKEAAKEHRSRTSCTILNKDTQQYEYLSVWKTTPAQLGHLGVGVQLYFQFMKKMGIVFLIMFILSSPSLFFNAAGQMVEDTSVLNQAFATLSIANLGKCPSSGCQSFTEVRERCGYTFDLPSINERNEDECDLTVQEIAQWIGALDGVALLLFLAFGIYFANVYIPKMVKQTDDANITPADYTVWLPSLPRRLSDEDHPKYEELLANHFRTVLSSAAKNPTEDPSVVQSVTLIHDYNGAIMKFTNKGTYLQELENTRALSKRASTSGREKVSARYTRKAVNLEQKIQRVEQTLRDQAKMTDESRAVVSAFVTFSHEHHKEKVLDEYRFARHPLFLLCQPERLRFQGTRINVKEACEPTDLYWQNLDFDPWKRRLRKALVLVLTFLVLVVCSFFVASLESLSDTQAGSMQEPIWVLVNTADSGISCINFCDWQLYGNAACDSEISADVVRIFDASGTTTLSISQLSDGSCAGSNWTVCNKNSDAVSNTTQAWLGIEFESAQAVKCMKLKQSEINSASYAKEMQPLACAEGVPPTTAAGLFAWDPHQSCQSMELVYPSSPTLSGKLSVVTDTSCATDPAEFIKYEVAVLAKQSSGDNALSDPTYTCFCKQQARSNMAGFMTPPWSSKEEELCSDWSMDMALTYAKLLGSVFAITILNELLLVLYKHFIAWERLTTVTEVAKSQLWKLFLAQFVNTGLLIFLVNAEIKDYPGILSIIQALSIGQGSYYDITGQWFTVLGTTLVITILIEVCTSTLMPILESTVIHRIKHRYYRKTKVTQDALNEAYMRPEWNLSLRLAQTLNVIFCVVMYSGGMPVLYFVGALYCLGAYWMDKWCLLKGSCRPPAYKQDVVRMAVVMLPLAAFLHTAVTGWAFGNQVLLPSEWSRLKPLAEQVFGITESEYDSVTEAYRMGVADGITLDWVKARFLDFAREAAWPQLLVFLASCIYYIVYYLWALVLKPFLSPFTFLVREWVLNQVKKWTAGRDLPIPDPDNKNMMCWTDAVEEMKTKGVVASYRLSKNPNYHAAYKALAHTANLVKRGSNPPTPATTNSSRWWGRSLGSGRQSTTSGSECDKDLRDTGRSTGSVTATDAPVV